MPNNAWAEEVAAEPEPYAVLNEDNTVLTFYYDEKKAERAGMSIGPFDQSYNRGWDSECQKITDVVFDSSFEEARPTSTANWFWAFTALTSITGIEYLRTDSVTDMYAMFLKCNVLTSLDLSTFNTANVTNMGNMFRDCSSLTSLNVSGFKNNNVTNMYEMFYGCSSLTNLDVSGFKTDNVTNMAEMFFNCSSLTNLDVSGFKTGNVMNMHWMFYGCSSLTSLDLSGFKTDNMTDMSEIFRGCSGLTSLDVSNFKTDNVTNMEGMFSGCSGLTSLDVGNFNTSNVTDMGGMFYGCSGLTGLDVSNFKTDNVTNMGNMFGDCSGLTSLDVSNFNTSNVTNMGCIFGGCSGLTSLDVSNFNTSKVTNMGGFFSGCSGLTSLDVSNFKTDNVESISGMFGDCSGLTSLDVSNFSTSKVTNMAGMFHKCSGLTSLDLSNFKTNNVTNMNQMFSYCSGITNLDLSNYNTEEVTTMNYMFVDCTGLTAIYAGSGWNTAKIKESTRMFGGCTKLVGGAGTVYDINHTDHTYAHIDGGPDNPGYFTDITDKGKEKMEQVAMPTFMFSGDQLFISSDTEDAKILYATSSINGEGTTDANGTRAMTANDITYTEYTDPLFITSDTIIMAKAIKDGMEDSEVNTLTYYYSAWMELLKAIDYGNQIFKQSERNENVSQDLREQLSSLITRAEVCYYSDRATTDYHEVEKLTHHIMEYAKQIEEQMQPTEKVAAPTFGFEGYNLTMATETEGATIRYMMEEWAYENIDSAYVQADKMTVDISGAIYEGPLNTVTNNVIVKAYASKDGMADSDISTLVYYGKAWQQLQDVIAYGERLIDEAHGNEKVNQELVDNLHWALEEGTMMYERRAEAPGQEATMWIERIGELCKQIEEQLSATTEQVETPKFKFTNNKLELVTETLDAKIYYAIQEFDNNLETDTIAKYARELQVSVDSIEYKGQIEANFDFIIKAMAVSEGMEDSELATLIYPFTEWQNMLQTIDIGNAVFSMILDADHSDEVAKLIEDVQMRMAEVENVYNNSRTEWDRETVRNEREYLKSMIDVIHNMWQDEQSQKTTAKYENHILTVEGDVSMAQALEQVGGRNVVAKDIAAIVWNSSQAITRSDIEGFGNPNLLIYVQTDSLAPEGVNNVVINGKAKSITLVDAESNNNFYAPMAFTAESISYTREFKQTTEKDVSRGWEGIALPFTVQKFTHESHGEIAPFGNDASIFHFWLHQMTDKGMVNATTIEANKPYIISMPNNGSYPEAYNQAGKVTFSAENVTVPVSDNTAIWTADGTIGMMSTYLRIEPSEYIYALNVGSTMESYAEGSVFVQNLREVKPFEVFTFHEQNHHEGAGARFISVSSLFGGEGTTGIIDVMKAAEPDGETWYDLNGRRLQSKPVRKGVYIKNGKKVVVK